MFASCVKAPQLLGLAHGRLQGCEVSAAGACCAFAFCFLQKCWERSWDELLEGVVWGGLAEASQL